MSSSRSRRWLWPTALLAAAGVAAAALFVSSRFDPGPTAAQQPPALPAPQERSAPTAPATQAWVPADAPPVPEPAEDVATDEPPAEPDRRADVAVTYAGWDGSSAVVEVNAFVGDVVEDGGTCTLTLTRGADTRTAEVAGSADAATTICAPMTVPEGQLAPGTWQAQVTYSSTTARGASQTVEVSVP